MRRNQDTYPVGVMCRLLSVSKSGFYAWDGRPMSPHARRDVELTALMHQIHERSYRSKPKRWAPDLVERNFVADRPDALWVADVTYVPTAEGWLYLAIVLDVFSRLVVGWRWLSASRASWCGRRSTWPTRSGSTRCGSPFGSRQYTAIAFGRRCRLLGVRPSMGSVGDCFDNAMAESFFATLECETSTLVDRLCFSTGV